MKCTLNNQEHKKTGKIPLQPNLFIFIVLVLSIFVSVFFTITAATLSFIIKMVEKIYGGSKAIPLQTKFCKSTLT